jgi:hypothetical protein
MAVTTKHTVSARKARSAAPPAKRNEAAKTSAAASTATSHGGREMPVNTDNEAKEIEAIFRQIDENLAESERQIQRTRARQAAWAG